MQQEQDYIQREIQRLSSFLKALVARVMAIDNNEHEVEYKQVQNELKDALGFGLTDLIKMSDDEFENQILNLDTEILKFLVELIAISIENIPVLDEKEKLRKRALLVLDIVDDQTQVYSLELVDLKSKLQE